MSRESVWGDGVVVAMFVVVLSVFVGEGVAVSFDAVFVNLFGNQIFSIVVFVV